MSPPAVPRASAGQATSAERNARVVRILLPIAVLAAGIAAWHLVVRLNDIPPYVLPGPGIVFKTLIDDWSILSQSLLTTLSTTLEGFVAARSFCR